MTSLLHQPTLAKLAFLLLLLLSNSRPASGATARWPRFRGVDGNGIGSTDFPSHFGPRSNLVWQTAIPAGHSSPCIWDDHVFLTGYATGQLTVICLDRSKGRTRWVRQIKPGRIERGAHWSDPATATPVTDGSTVFVYFGSFGLQAYDFEGIEQWRKPLPVPTTQHGPGTSPVLAGDLLLLNCDQDTDSSLLAVRKRDGQTVWETKRSEFRRGFSTPLPWPAANPEQVIVPGTLRLVSYNLADGSERWSVRGLPNEMVSSPATGDGIIYVSGWTPGSGVNRMPDYDGLLMQGDMDHDGRLTREEAPAGPARQHFQYIDANKDGLVTRDEYAAISRIFNESKNAIIAVKPDGTGDVTDTRVIWRATRGLPYVPSPLYYLGKIYLVKNGGLASCLDADTGKPVYQEERLGALGDYYSSPVAASGKVCVASQAGVVTIYRAGDPLEVLAHNPLGEPILATPAIVDGQIHVRTVSQYYVFGYPTR